MADVKKVATRVSYGETLVELGAEHDDFVVLDADLAASTQTGKFKAAYPDRFFDVGIAEQNLMSLAAGIATTGRTAFVSSFAMFAACGGPLRNRLGESMGASRNRGQAVRGALLSRTFWRRRRGKRGYSRCSRQIRARGD